MKKIYSLIIALLAILEISAQNPIGRFNGYQVTDSLPFDREVFVSVDLTPLNVSHIDFYILEAEYRKGAIRIKKRRSCWRRLFLGGYTDYFNYRYSVDYGKKTPDPTPTTTTNPTTTTTTNPTTDPTPNPTPNSNSTTTLKNKLKPYPLPVYIIKEDKVSKKNVPSPSTLNIKNEEIFEVKKVDEIPDTTITVINNSTLAYKGKIKNKDEKKETTIAKVKLPPLRPDQNYQLIYQRGLNDDEVDQIITYYYEKLYESYIDFIVNSNLKGTKKSLQSEGFSFESEKLNFTNLDSFMRSKNKLKYEVGNSNNYYLFELDKKFIHSVDLNTKLFQKYNDIFSRDETDSTFKVYLKKELKENPNFVVFETSDISTSSYKLETRTIRQLKPDVGFAYFPNIYSQVNNENGRAIMAGTIGFHYNFRSLDYNNYFW